MMNLNKIIEKCFLGILLITIISCSDDFIDVPPTQENSEDYFNSEEDYQNDLL